MNKLNIDFNALLPYVIDAFSKVYGEEYRDIISKKLSSAVMFQYYDIEGLNNYILNIKICKRREYSIKFLDRIGIDVSKYKKDNYIQPLDDEVENVLKCLIGNSYSSFSLNDDSIAPIKAFNEDNKSNSTTILENKLLIINFLLGDSYQKITKENLDSFTKTGEYQKVLRKVSELNVVYQQLLSEYRKWEMQLEPYKEYIKNEEERKEEILNKKKISMLMEIKPLLPEFIKSALSNMPIEKQVDTIIGSFDIGSISNIEKINFDKIKNINQKHGNFWRNFFKLNPYLTYLKKLGISLPSESCKTEEDINNFLRFLNQDNIREFFPSPLLIEDISSIRKKYYEDAIREYYTTRSDIADIIKQLNNHHKYTSNYILDIMKNKYVCITTLGIHIDDEFASLMFYTIRNNDIGILDFSFVHECGHIIDQSEKGDGFEIFNAYSENIPRNPYNNKCRKYEKFNEALNDIFTIEAIELLHNEGIYLIEPKEYVSSDMSNINTALITKTLLKPLLSKFRKQVVSAKINANPEELTRYIGIDNFEELVDSISKIEYIFTIISSISGAQRDAMSKEYFDTIERVKQIYVNIDNYYAQHFGNLEVANSVTRSM